MLNVFKINEEIFTFVMLKNSSLSSILSASWEIGPSSLVMLSRSGTIRSTKAVVVIRVSCEKVRVEWDKSERLRVEVLGWEGEE